MDLQIGSLVTFKKMKNIKSRIQKGETLLGCWLNLGSSIAAEIVASAGFDWVLIDLEHGSGGENEVISQLQAIGNTGSAAFVRIEGLNAHRTQRVLDFGSEGIMCPHIGNEDQAKKLVSGMRYTPLGTRGVAKMVRATNFGIHFETYVKQANDTLVGLAQIESKLALSNLDSIAAVDGIDVLFIGPADLTMDMGIFGQFDHPDFIDAIKKTVCAAEKYHKAVGILIFNPDDFSKYHDLGIRLIACGADGNFVVEGARNTVDKMRKQN